jgi:hypothetical protein
MAEMMVNLRVLRDLEPVLDEQKANGVEIRRARIDESDLIAEWVRENINPNWGVVCEVALELTPPSCFIAYQKNTADETDELSAENILGFACYDVVTKGVFGPSGVREDHQNDDISTALLMSCLHAMAEEDYAHAVIGWASTTEGYAG